MHAPKTYWTLEVLYAQQPTPNQEFGWIKENSTKSRILHKIIQNYRRKRDNARTYLLNMSQDWNEASLDHNRNLGGRDAPHNQHLANPCRQCPQPCIKKTHMVWRMSLYVSTKVEEKIQNKVLEEEKQGEQRNDSRDPWGLLRVFVYQNQVH